MADYVVEVGSDICKNIDLTDNQLICRPPKQQPQSNQNTSFTCDQLLSIYVCNIIYLFTLLMLSCNTRFIYYATSLVQFGLSFHLRGTRLTIIY